jgi:hypothetical protein
MPPRFRTLLLSACLLALACLLPSAASAAKTKGTTAAAKGSATAATGGISPNDPRFRPPKRAKLINGIAYAPKSAPQAVKNAIAAANSIVRKPYRYGGGHNPSFQDSAYDCSGSVSFALHGGGLLTSPLDSSSFMKWGQAGKGRWITVYANPDHAYVVIAGLRFDTSRAGSRNTESGPRWRDNQRSASGYTARHPAGL